jgi:hypothetical protein
VIEMLLGRSVLALRAVALAGLLATYPGGTISAR